MQAKTFILKGSVATVALCALAACTNPYDPGQRAAGGGLFGAGAGAALGAAASGGSGTGALTGALIGGAVGALAGVATTPPPRDDAMGPPPPPPGPAERMSWDPGHWQWDGYRYVWLEGRYIERPHRTAVWIPGHWERHRRGWVWEDGRWRG